MKTRLFFALLLLIISGNFKLMSQTGAAMNFDGVNDQVKFPGSTMGAFTIEFWMRTTQVGPAGSQWYHGAGIVDSEVSGAVNDYGVSLLGNKIAFGTGNPDVTITSTTNVNTGNWFHVAAMFTSNPNGQMWLYINGNLEAYLDPGVSSNARNTNANLCIGSILTNVNYFNGDVDEVRLWNYVIPNCVLQSRMNCELTWPTSGLLRYFKFNQGIASGNNTGITQVTNLSGSQHGNITGMAMNGATSNFISPGAITSGLMCDLPVTQVTGNSNNVNDGATSTSTTNNTNFGSVCYGSAPVTQTFSIENNGIGNLSIGTLSIGGTNASMFSVSAAPSSPVAAGNTATFSITFTPSALVTAAATLSFTTNECAIPVYNFALGATVINAPTVTVNSGSICTGSSFTIVPGGATSYTISGGSAIVSPVTTTNYTVTGTSAAGCYNTNNAVCTVSVYSIPVISVSNGAICSGQTFSISPTGAATYTFSGGSANVSPVTTSTYAVTGTSSAGCAASNTAICTVTVNSLPTASITASGTVFCQGQSSMLTTTLLSGETVNWYKNNVIISGATSAVYTATSSGSYKAVVTNSNGCSATSNTVTIVVNTLPTANVTSSPQNFCPGVTSITLSANVVSGATYSWLLNSAVIGGATGPVYTATAAGQYEVVITNTNGCTNTSTVTNLQNATQQNFTVTSSTNTFCTGSLLSLNSNLESGSTYSWFKNGAAFGSPAIGQNTINANTSGTYYVQVTNSFGCVSLSNTLTLSTVALPTASISSAVTAICVGDSVQLNAVNVPGTTYEWFKNNISMGLPQAGNTSKYATTIGAYKVVVSGACTNTSNIITITQLNPPSSAGSISGANLFCAGDVMNFGIATVGGATSYSWTVSPLTAASIASGQGSNNITLNTTNQNFVLTVTPMNSCGAGGAASLNVALNSTLSCGNVVLFAANNTNICAGSTVVFTNYTNPNLFMGLTEVWNFGSGASPATATGNGPHNVTYSSQGLKTVTLDYVDVFNNSFGNETKTNYINVAGSVNTSAITGSTSIACNAAGLVYQVTNTPGSTYNWSVPSGATIVSGQGTNSIVMNFGGTNGNVTVTETNFGGCVGSPVSLGVSCIVTGIEKNLSRNGISVFPNPVTDVINIQSENDSEKEIIIMNAEGKEVIHENRKEKNCAVSTSHLAPGFYFLRLSSGSDTVTFKIIKL